MTNFDVLWEVALYPPVRLMKLVEPTSNLDSRRLQSYRSQANKPRYVHSKNHELVLNYVASFNAGDLDRLCQLFTSDAQIFGVLGWGGIDKARPIWEQLIRCFKINLDIQGMVEEGNTIAVRYIERGTFSEAFRGTEPTGKPYEIAAMEWFTFKDNLIFQRWGARDSAAMFRQMGIPLN